MYCTGGAGMLRLSVHPTATPGCHSSVAEHKLHVPGSIPDDCQPFTPFSIRHLNSLLILAVDVDLGVLHVGQTEALFDIHNSAMQSSFTV